MVKCAVAYAINNQTVLLYPNYHQIYSLLAIIKTKFVYLHISITSQ